MYLRQIHFLVKRTVNDRDFVETSYIIVVESLTNDISKRPKESTIRIFVRYAKVSRRVKDTRKCQIRVIILDIVVMTARSARSTKLHGSIACIWVCLSRFRVVDVEKSVILITTSSDVSDTRKLSILTVFSNDVFGDKLNQSKQLCFLDHRQVG